jgi:putative nucleotidyltransferase with HDIG domain
MSTVRIDDLKPGNILAEDVINADGRFLLGKGITIDPKHLRVLKIWGITSVEIQGTPGEDLTVSSEAIDPAVLQAAERYVREYFFLADLNHPFMKEVFEVCTRRRAKRMLADPTEGGTAGSREPEISPVFPPRASPGDENRKKKLAALLEKDVRLPSLPEIYAEITEVLGDPHSSAIHVANVISKDPNLSARLLKIVNSAFYGFPSKIDTISRAVMIVGSRQLSTLALGTSVVHIFRDIPPDLVDMKSFWQHSVACGIGARMLASYKNMPNTERLFVAGLLHDIGRILIYKHFPRDGREVLLKARQARCLLRSAEIDLLGFDHAQIGGNLLKKWMLPPTLERAVADHHQPAESQYPVEASAVYVADILVNALGIGTSGERYVPPLFPEVWSEIGIPQEAISKIVPFIDRQIEEITRNFFDER